MMFALGAAFAMSCSAAWFWFAFLRSTSSTKLVEMSWTETPERWASLRRILLDEVAARKVKQA